MTYFDTTLSTRATTAGGQLCMCFFFSSRRRHTIFDCDWSSDVCSSDLSPLSVPKMFSSSCLTRSLPQSFDPEKNSSASSMIGRGFATRHLAVLDLRRRSEEHTSELQSQSNLVCRLLLERNKPHAYFFML